VQIPHEEVFKVLSRSLATHVPPAGLTSARDAVLAVAGPAGLLEVAATISFFEAVTRLVDGTGHRFPLTLALAAAAMNNGIELARAIRSRPVLSLSVGLAASAAVLYGLGWVL
jgi:hypothetical protein